MSRHLSLLGLAFIAMLSPTPAAAIDCVNYDDYIHWPPFGNPEELVANGILVADGYAYAKDGWDPSGGLHVFDLADPEHPLHLGQLDDIGDPLAKSGSRLICEGYDDRVQLVDLSDPGAPVLIGSSAELVYALAADGELAAGTFRSSGNSYLRVFDTTGPGAPSLLADLFVTTDASSAIAMAGNLACIRYTGPNARLQPVDLTDPAHPVLLAPIPDGDLLPAAFAMRAGRLYIYGDWTAGEALLRILDVTDAENPVVLGSVELASVFGDARLVLGDDRLLLVGSYGLRVLNLADESAPTLIGSMSDPFETADADLQGQYAYVVGIPTYFDSGQGTAWLRVADLSAEVAASPLGELELTSWGCIETSGGLAYTAAGGLLDVTDISDPAQPLAVGAMAFPGYCYALLVEGSRAYLLSGVSGLMHLLSVDLSNPSAPLLEADLPLPYEDGGCLALRGDRLYIGLSEREDFDSYPRLCTVDIGDPTAPVLLASTNGGAFGFPQDLLLSEDGQYLILATNYWAAELQVFSLANPDAPALVDYHTVAGELHCAIAEGDLLVTSASASTYNLGKGIITLLDISDPLQIVTLSTLYTADPAWDLLIGGSVPAGRLYLCSRAGGLTACAIDNPLAPVELASYAVPMRRMADGGGFAVGVRNTSLVTVPFLCAPTAAEPAPSLASGLRAYPNPFNPSTILYFNLRQAGAVDLAIYDLAGRRVRSLLAGKRDAGELRVTWDGCDEAGSAQASGVYLARLEAASGQAVAKLLLLK